MKKQSGVTLITLVITIIILGILTGITLSSSIDMYLTMEFENYVAELEELQAAVDKMCEKYKVDQYTSYIDSENGFFIKRYNKIPGTLALAENKEKSEDIIEKYFGGNSEFHSGYVFYFSAEEIEEFFNIKGIDFDIIVDFATRYVYSVEGMDNLEDEDKTYSLIDLDSTYILQKNVDGAASSATGITFVQTALKSGETSMYEISLVLEFLDEAQKYDIKKAYYSKDGGEKWIEVDYLGNCKYSGNTVTFYIYESGTYYFKVEDTTGKITTNIQGASDAVYTTLNFN